jgi:hypothetical protein
VWGQEPLAGPMLEPPVGDEAPTDDAITDYDKMLFVVYLRLLDAEAAGPVPWEEVCRIVLRIDPARERTAPAGRTTPTWPGLAG